MNPRERFLATMRFQERDRVPICDFGFWDETFQVWYEQGLPRWVVRANTDGYFGMDPLFSCMLGAESTALVAPADPNRSRYQGVYVGLMPAFEETVLEDRSDREVVQQVDGVRVLRDKSKSTIPLHLGHLLTDRASWRQHYLPRLDPADPRRYPDHWEQCVELWRDDTRELPVFLFAGSLYGWIRNWMGLEAVSMLVYDDPAWFEEMVTAAADCVCGVLGRVLESGGRFEACGFWEDMCYRNGPLLAPKHFKQFLVPHYRRVTDLLHRHGIEVVWVDCDGKIDALLPHWLEVGVNCMFPIEVGTWGADAIQYRRRYGRELLMMGGYDKRILTRSKAEIASEIQRLAPLVEEGGFIPFCDHRVPPDVPLENYLHYVETARRIWGHERNLRPMRR